MKWRVLDLTAFDGRVSVSRGALKVGERTAPLDDVAVIMLGQKCSWGFGIVHHADKFDIAVLICDWRNVPIAALNHWSDNSRVGARHRAQAEQSLPRKKNAWMQTVKAKIRGQANNLESFQRPHAATLKRIAQETKSGDPGNTEGNAAQFYWNSLFEEENFRRNRNIEHGANAFLNYGYTVLRGHLLAAVAAAGLCPTLGIFHRNRSNAFALVDDLIEPLRPAVDATVLKLVTQGVLDLGKESKTALVSVVSEPFYRGGDDMSVGTVATQFAQNFAQYVEGQIETLSPPIWMDERNG